MTQVLRVGIVGCGQIADAHIKEIGKVASGEVVAVCDSAIDLAERAARVFSVPAYYDNLERMLKTESLDVIHVTTPATSHKAIALAGLMAGAHVYVEKPFTLNVNEAREVLDYAKSRDRIVCVGHNELFDTVWLEVRDILGDGVLGEIVHVESLQGYDLSGQFGALLRADPNHWVRKLPGAIFQNTISHPVYKITDCLPGWWPSISARWYERSSVNVPIPVELRANMWAHEHTAFLWVSSMARPVQRITRIYGTKGSLEVDLQAQSLMPMISAVTRGPFIPMEYAWRKAARSAGTLARFIGRFAGNRIHFFQGMNGLIRAFYQAILTGGESPTPQDEIIRVTKLMDQIFASCLASGDPR